MHSECYVQYYQFNSGVCQEKKPLVFKSIAPAVIYVVSHWITYTDWTKLVDIYLVFFLLNYICLCGRTRLQKSIVLSYSKRIQKK